MVMEMVCEKAYRKSRWKTENFQMKNSDIFPISAQNIDCGTH